MDKNTRKQYLQQNCWSHINSMDDTGDKVLPTKKL